MNESELISKQATQAQWDDIRSELRHREDDYELSRKLAVAVGKPESVSALKAWRRDRVRELILLLACLLLCACSGEQEPPPYLVYFASDVPQGDRDMFGAAAAEWNRVVAPGDPVFWVGSEPANGRCGVEVVRVADRSWRYPSESFIGACLMRIEYGAGLLKPCIALHELTHKLLGIGHVPGTVFAEYGCDYPNVLAPVLVGMAQERWGL